MCHEYVAGPRWFDGPLVSGGFYDLSLLCASETVSCSLFETVVESTVLSKAVEKTVGLPPVRLTPDL